MVALSARQDGPPCGGGKLCDDVKRGLGGGYAGVRVVYYTAGAVVAVVTIIRWLLGLGGLAHGG